MHLETIETFLTVLEEGSLTRTADRLHLSPSTVTTRLHTLERELGLKLVHRHKLRATPTAAGLRFKPNAETMMGLWSQSKQEAALPNAVTAVGNLGVHADLWPTRGRQLFTFLRETEPTMALGISVGGPVDLVRWLATGRTDLAITHSPAVNQGQTSYELAPDHLVLVSTQKDGPIAFDPGYVLVDHGVEFGRQHTEAYADATVARVSFNTSQLALDHILAHGGSAYVPLKLVSALLQQSVVFRLAAVEFDRPTWLVVSDGASAEWGWLDKALDVLRAS